jgi:hypothetical protein
VYGRVGDGCIDMQYSNIYDDLLVVKHTLLFFTIQITLLFIIIFYHVCLYVELGAAATDNSSRVKREIQRTRQGNLHSFYD